MRRRDEAGGKTVKPQRHKALKGGNAPKKQRRSSLAAGKETNIARLTGELNEALQQQTALSEVLRLMQSFTYQPHRPI